jgi:hypothetical protein
MNEDLHVSNFVSGLVMLAAIVITYNVYSTYKDEVIAAEYEDVQSSMEQTASVLTSLRMEKEAMQQTATTSEEITEETTN